MSIYDYLTENDKAMIKSYIRNFACNGDENNFSSRYEMSDLSYILRFWSRNKEKLFHAFGDNFIVEKEIEMDIPRDTLERDIYEIIQEGKNTKQIRDKDNNIEKSSKFFRELKNSISKTDNWRLMECLASYESLVSNRIPYDRKFVLPNGEEFNVQKGAKTIKMIGKYAEIAGLAGFESFRLVHSQILNQKKIKGTLCISIHPLDYMTMSDNENGWHSCMNWVECGEYRQGTVEMMNSNDVVIAYIKDDNRSLDFSDYSWNSKKWRQLFIIAPDCITAVKGYPYHNDNLMGEAFKFIESYMDVEYPSNFEVFNANGGTADFNFSKETINMTCDLYYRTYNMYNDINANDCCYFKPAINFNENVCHTILYSGDSECMWCGSTDIDDVNCLMCNDCDSSSSCYCDQCGDRLLYEDDIYYLDDESLCYDCYNRYAVEAIYFSNYRQPHITAETEQHDYRNCVQMYVIDKNCNIIGTFINENDDEAYFYIGDFNRFIEPCLTKYYTTNSNYDHTMTYAGAKIYIQQDWIVEDSLLAKEMENIYHHGWLYETMSGADLISPNTNNNLKN